MRDPVGPPLDFAHAPLAGTVLVEASAGTGKTWTIAALVLRLLLEEHVPGVLCRIEDILVVTYTNAATEELRERILALLVAARQGLENGVSDDPRVRHALRVTEHRRTAARDAMDLAIASFDLAPIHTIHGFCQRALADHAFESGRQFDAGILADETALREAAAQDFWRSEMVRVEAVRAAHLLHQVGGPRGLLARATPALDRPYAELLDPGPSPDLRAVEAQQLSAARSD
jgi:exodeoxyribonuclease V beta subunit